MFQTKPLFLYKYKLAGQQKANFYLILCLITIFFAACKDSESNHKEVSNDSTSKSNNASNGNAVDTSTAKVRTAGLKADGLNATFHDLYLTKAEFNAIIAQFRPNPYKKFVFQFFFPEDALEGSPTLALWPSKINNSEFPDKPQQILHYGRTSFINLPKNLYLGDLQTDVAPLKTAVDTTSGCNDKCVLFFAVKESPTLTYDIYLVKDSTTIINRSIQQLDLKSLTPISTANPSPPKPAN